MEVEQLVVGRRGIDLEIAGVDDDAERRGDGQGHALTMECVTWMNSILNGPISMRSPRLHAVELGTCSSISYSSRRRSTSASVKAVP